MPISAPTTTVITAPWNGSANVETVSYDAGNSQVLTVFIMGPAFNIQGITYGGQALMRRIIESDGNLQSVAIWDIENPSSGVNDLIFTSDRATSIDCVIYSLTGLNSSNLRGETLFNSNGAASSTSLSFTNAEGAIIVDGLVTSDAVTSTVGPLPQTVGLNGGTALTGALTYTSHEISEEANSSVSWSMSGSNRIIQVAISYNPSIAASITNVNTTNTVTDGQQSVPVVVSNLTPTSMSLRVGATTIPLTGLAGSGNNYTINLPDVTTFTGDTLGVPFGTVELIATDGTNTATIDITLNPKSGYAVVDVLNAVTTIGSMAHNRPEGAPTNGSQFYYPTAGNTVVTGDLLVETDLNSITGFLWNIDNSTWEVTTKTINAAPTLANISTQNVAAGANVTITASATDADAGDTLTYTFTVVQPVGLTLSGTGNSRTFTAPIGSSASTVLIDVTANDGTEDSNTVRATVNVAAENVEPAPTVSVNTIGTLTDGDTGTAVATTTNTTSVAWSATGAVSINASTGAYTVNSAGAWSITATATGAGGSASDTQNGTAQAQVISSTASFTVTGTPNADYTVDFYNPTNGALIRRVSGVTFTGGNASAVLSDVAVGTAYRAVIFTDTHLFGNVGVTS